MLILFLVLFGLQSAMAQQDEEAPSASFQLGLNATQFVNTFFSFNENQGNPGSYLLHFKSIKNQQAFRLGLGFALSKTTTDVDVNQGERVNKNNFINLRIGYEWHVPLTRRWLTYFGFDALVGFSNFKSEFDPGFGRITTESENLNLGGGGVAGVQFNINERISLATESTLYFVHRNSTTEQRFPDQPGSEDKKQPLTKSPLDCQLRCSFKSASKKLFLKTAKDLYLLDIWPNFEYYKKI